MDLTLVAQGGIALVGILLGAALGRQAGAAAAAQPAPRETSLPPHPCEVSRREFEALRDAVDEERQRAQAHREQVIGDVREVRTILAERTRRGQPRDGGQRERDST